MAASELYTKVRKPDGFKSVSAVTERLGLLTPFLKKKKENKSFIFEALKVC